MNTKRTIAHEAIRILSGGNQSRDSQLDDRDVMRKVGHVLNMRVKANFFENYKMGEPGVDGMYVATFPKIDVKLDSDRGEYYSVVPNIYVALPKNRGIRSISTMKDDVKNHAVFIIRDSGSKSIYSFLPAANLQGNIGVYPEGMRFYYDKEIFKRGITKVLMKLVVGAPDNIGPDDALPIDASEIASIITDVIKFYIPSIPQDKLNNNNKDE